MQMRIRQQQPGSLGTRPGLYANELRRHATDKQEMIDFLHASVDRGITFF